MQPSIISRHATKRLLLSLYSSYEILDGANQWENTTCVVLYSHTCSMACSYISDKKLLFVSYFFFGIASEGGITWPSRTNSTKTHIAIATVVIFGSNVN